MDADIFQQEVKQVQKLLYRIAWACMGNLQDVEDMVQDAIETAWVKRFSLRDTNKFAGWIVRILTNCCKNALRRRKVLSFFPLEQVLLPCWVVWCEYHPDGAASERASGENSSVSLMYDGNNEYYRPLVINAQTGELVDPESEAEGRCLCPDMQ